MNPADLCVESPVEIHLGSSPLCFRIIFSPKKYRNCHRIEVRAFDSSQTKIGLEVTRWGTKMRVSLQFSEDNVDGVARVVVDDGTGPVDALRFWFVR